MELRGAVQKLLSNKYSIQVILFGITVSSPHPYVNVPSGFYFHKIFKNKNKYMKNKTPMLAGSLNYTCLSSLLQRDGYKYKHRDIYPRQFWHSLSYVHGGASFYKIMDVKHFDPNSIKISGLGLL